jgi:hypothetical protein
MEEFSGAPAKAVQALVASLPEPVPVSAHSGDGPSREAEAKVVLAKMIEDRSAWAANNQRVLDLLQPEWDRFERRDGHNVYAARIYAEHTSSLRKDKKELAALEYVLGRLCERDAEHG